MQCTNQKLLYLPVRGVETPVNVPCGKCIPCLMSKRADWSYRLEQEHRVSSSAHFVTLTYDEKHLRTTRSLDKRDLQLYLKRLRKKDETTRIRYYGVGEYGSKSGRPHYHVLLFNAVDEQHIRSAWTDSRGESIGIVHVGRVTAASVAYVTKYMIQKDQYPEGVEKPFALMSRAYGIGGRYLSDDVVQWHRDGDRNYIQRPDSIRGRLPRFYRDKIFWRPDDKQRISAAAMKLTLDNQEKEINYYKKKHGPQWALVMQASRDAVVSRVRQKIQFSQTF